ncbi:MAG: PhoH family protein [Bacteroidota bacterium]
MGVENANLREITNAFPQSKIVARGNEIRIIGSNPEIIRINDIFNHLIEHQQKFGNLTRDDVKAYIAEDMDAVQREEHDQTVVYGKKGVAVKPKTSNQRELVEKAYKNDVVFAVGPAGTGKTFLAVALAVRALKNKQVKKIIITRPAVEAGENLGFLPGDMKEKVDPYLRPVYDALGELIPSEKFKYYQEQNIIEIAPIAYMRGRTLSNAFVLIDEAQNTTSMQLKMLLTRLGPGSRMIVTGDISQIDLPRKVRSGLVEAVSILGNIEGISVVKLEGKDVVRHRLVGQIISAYQKLEDAAQENVREKR